jgi:hypothetical protein
MVFLVSKRNVSLAPPPPSGAGWNIGETIIIEKVSPESTGLMYYSTIG